MTVIGETLRRWVRVRNAGALGTAFTFSKLPARAAAAAPPPPQPPHSALAKAGAERIGSGGGSARSQRSVHIREGALHSLSLYSLTYECLLYSVHIIF